jgi:2-dehydropantoate 2-reductase
MRILIVGAGATGGYFGARLADVGRDVTFLVRPERADRLRRDGLRVLTPQGDLNLKPRLLVAGAATEPFDVVLLAVKAFGLEPALDDFGPAVGPETMILPFLNGMRHIDLLVKRFGEAPVLGGVCVVAATLDRLGRIVQLASGLEALAYGERNGALTMRVTELDAELQGAGFDARLSTAILQEMWEKWVMLASAGTANCLLRGTVGEIEAVEGGADVTLRCLAETSAVAAASGYPPRERFIEGTKTILTARGSGLSTSMYRDMRNGLPIEVEHILGDLISRARRFGLDTPLLDAATVQLRIYLNRLLRKA